MNATSAASIGPSSQRALDGPQVIEPRPTHARMQESAGDDRAVQRSEPLPAKAEPPTEFQRFVDASTGRLLPIYGIELFSTSPISFGAVSDGRAPGEMVVGAGDELRIRAWGQVNFNANVGVSRTGELYLPKVGAVHVAGLTLSEITAHLESTMRQVYRNFTLSVDVGEIHSIEIYMTGRSRRPGECNVSALNTLIDAVFTCGGPSAAGSMRHLIVKRAGKVETDLDLYALLVDGDKTGDIQLQSGDLIYIPPVGPQAALLGSVREAAIYELRSEETIGDLIRIGGGKTSTASGSRISVERITDHTNRAAFEIAQDQDGTKTVLVDGDIVRIDPIVSSFRETVTLRGAVANAGHFRWHEGMHLSEMMPDRDSLEKRDYWWLRTQLGLPNPASVWNDERDVLPGKGESGVSLSQLQINTNAVQAGKANLSGTQEQPPRIKPDALTSPELETNWNYAVIERLNPETMKRTLIPFGLGKLVLNHDRSQDLALMAGDVITIFTQSDIQIPLAEETKYMTLEGEFIHPGVYSVLPSDTLRSIVERAGGLTPEAYTYAASFTRKSTRLLEQRQIDEYADAMQHQLPHNEVSKSTPATAADATMGQQAAWANRELVTRARATRATGRIVLDMKCRDTTDCTLPDIHLEDGDRLLVPVMPDTVEVIGAVFNSRSFMYHNNAKAMDYLHLAGGATRNADQKRMFVLRADGTVLSHDGRGVGVGHGIGRMSLHPGDSLVVPEKAMRLSPLAQVLAWTQFISQTSLPAAEATTLVR
jgi:protein involved in polysaccharide export with SLBB domain